MAFPPKQPALREMASLCLRRFKGEDERAVNELFYKAGAAEELEKARREACVMRRFRRRKQRRSGPEVLQEKRRRDEMVCPITMSRASEPVLLSDGHIYERRAIDAWLAKSTTSPLTREALFSRPYVSWNKVEAAFSKYENATCRDEKPYGDD